MARSTLAALAVCIFLTAGCSDTRVVTGAYATKAEAAQEGAVAGGWVPAGIPPGAYELRTAYDPGSGRSWGLFNFPLAEADALKAMLQPGDAPMTAVSCDIPGRIEWWPRLLRGQIDLQQADVAGLKGHRSADGRLIVFVNWSQGRAYYWSS